MAATTERRRRPRGSGSIRWRRGRPYAVYRHALTGKQTWVGCDSEEQADAFLAQWAADRKAARMATKAALLEPRLERRSVVPRARRSRGRSASCSAAGRSAIAAACRSRRCASTGPASTTSAGALGAVLARSLTDEHFEAYKRAKLDGIDVGERGRAEHAAALSCSCGPGARRPGEVAVHDPDPRAALVAERDLDDARRGRPRRAMTTPVRAVCANTVRALSSAPRPSTACATSATRAPSCTRQSS